MRCCDGYYESFSGPWCDNSDTTPTKCLTRQKEETDVGVQSNQGPDRTRPTQPKTEEPKTEQPKTDPK